VGHHGAAGAVGITASHNPAEWNALKLVSGEGMFLDQAASARFRARLAERDPARAPWDALGAVGTDAHAVDRHLEAILAAPEIDVQAIRAARLHVALDCVRGAGGVMVPRLLEELGCTLSAIHTEPDGRFPRDPEPTAEHLAELGELVRESGAAIGLAVDPDADRLSLVDDRGRAMGEDLTLALATDVVLRRTPGTVVTNLSTSRVVEDVASAHGAPVVRSPVGEINVARRMQAEGAVVGGEGNGGVILPSIQHTRDAPMGIALVLQGLARAGAPVSRVVEAWPTYTIVKEKRAFDRGALDGAYEALAETLQADGTDRSDGLRLTWDARRSWLHVRPSGTEPVVRLIAEAPEADDARALVARAGDILEGVA
jgi:phosphomannomutase